jgi:hypothetical protein
MIPDGCEESMRRLMPVLFVALITGADQSVAQETVEARGVASAVKLEEVVSGHLADLNGKFRLRATEVIIESGGYLGPHHHAGPGIRFVASGKTKSPVRIIFFEILPVPWSGPPVIPPKAY